MFAKKILAAVGIAAALATVPAAAAAREDQRFYVANVDKESLDMVDLGSISQSGANRRAWSSSIFATTQTPSDGKNYDIASGLGEYDCAGNRMRLISLREWDAAGNLVFSTDDATDWRDVKPETILGEELKAVCAPDAIDPKNILTGTLPDLRERYLKAITG